MVYTRSRRPALTLIELLIVTSILALVGAFVVPTYQLILSQLELNSAVAQVADFVRSAQQKTVTEQKLYGVTFTTNGTTVPLYLFNSANSTKTTQNTLTLPSNITISAVNFSGNSDIQFATSGVPNFSGNIILTDTIRNRSREIDIRPSGAVINNQSEF